MKKKLVMLFLLGAAGICLLIPTTVTLGQQYGGKGKGGKGGGGPGGGPGGGYGAMFADPSTVDKIFDRMSQNHPGYIVISESKGMGGPMQEWANANNVTGGQLTREQFQQFGKWYGEQLSSGQIQLPNYGGGKGGGNPGGGNFGGKGGFGGPGGGQQQPVDLDAMAVARFKQADLNGDNYLTEDEMSNTLKTIQPNGEPLWKKYDKNNDGKLDLEEYKAYFKEAANARNGALPGETGADALILEEEWEKRPVVLRAGKLPKEMPPWFAELDTDKDGQIGYYEWMKSGKSWEEFNQMDRNGDGLLTAEEVIWYLKIKIKGNDDMADVQLAMRPNMGQGGNRFQMGGMGPGYQMQMMPGQMPGYNPGGGPPRKGGGNPYGPPGGGQGGPPGGGKGGKGFGGKGKGGGNNNNGG
jgi:Ca2+-binding EF-hand superfamily protein